MTAQQSGCDQHAMPHTLKAPWKSLTEEAMRSLWMGPLRCESVKAARDA